MITKYPISHKPVIRFARRENSSEVPLSVFHITLHGSSVDLNEYLMSTAVNTR
jgi:hypothetical protein